MKKYNVLNIKHFNTLINHLTDCKFGYNTHHQVVKHFNTKIYFKNLISFNKLSTCCLNKQNKYMFCKKVSLTETKNKLLVKNTNPSGSNLTNEILLDEEEIKLKDFKVS